MNDTWQQEIKPRCRLVITRDNHGRLEVQHQVFSRFLHDMDKSGSIHAGDRGYSTHYSGMVPSSYDVPGLGFINMDVSDVETYAIFTKLLEKGIIRA